MAKSNSMKKQLSTCTTKSSNEDKIINYEAAYKLQENDIRLQNALRTMIQELSDILSKSSTSIKELQKEWHKFFTDNEKNLTQYENLWFIFDAAVSSMDFFTEKNDDIIENLESVRNSIPYEKKHQLLKHKIQQMQSTCNKLSNEITDLKNQKAKLQNQIRQQRTNSWPRIIEQNTTAKLNLHLSMTQQLTNFVESFNIHSNGFKKALAQCDPEKDLNQWKENILHKNPEQSFGSSDEDSDDQKTSRYLKSNESRSIKNENSDKKNIIRQPSFQSTSV
ncbi:unnamed protein product [Rotaria sordida]|uniref:Uncharacterized protein n=1 Tax=Rotaria sordida TaxID=392033 RepID=A0A815KJM3_9BILA|nr:unnamed protein product [Rotaria sordida]CAF3923384.1 unnamed protein product [Rotaria sordida]